jgi:hypothetical protein
MTETPARSPRPRRTLSATDWEFSALTGLGINPDDAQLKSYGCRVGEDGTIYVDIGR